MVKCHEVPRLPHKTTLQPVLKPSTRMRFCSFPHRRCDGTKEASDSRRDMLEHQKEHFVRDVFITFHTSQLQSRRLPTSFLTNRSQNRRFVRGFRRFSSQIATLGTPRNLHLVTTSRSADNAIRQKPSNTTHLKRCACHAK